MEAVKVLEKKKEDMLALVNSKLRLAIEDANNLAAFEKHKVEERFRLKTSEIKNQEIEDYSIRTRSMALEGICYTHLQFIETKQRHASKSDLAPTTGATTSKSANFKHF